MSNGIVIAGPTASGKSAFAITIAEKLGGDIINADAMQVYRDLRVLTARPSAAEETTVPHHLYGVADGADHWSAGKFAREASKICDDVIAKGRVPIIVGGTGLWIKSLTVGLSPIPDTPAEIVQAARDRFSTLGPDAFRAEVLAQDPEMEWLKPADTQRHLRAWSVFETTGKPLSFWQKAPPKPVTDIQFDGYILCPDREVLYERCDQRFLNMLDEGAIEEVIALEKRALPAHLPVMKAVGVPEISAMLDGTMERDDAIALAQQSTRRLAKRQMTWFRGQASEWAFHDDTDELMSIALSCVDEWR